MRPIVQLQEEVGLVMSLIKLDLRSKLLAQGHGGTDSSLSKSLEFEIRASANVIIGSMYANDYWVYVNAGVKKSRIPYTRGGPRRGGTSKYIEGLIKYFRFNRGLSEKKAKRAAFATANKHKEEGMPTRASFRFSRDGTRLGFVDSTLKIYEDTVIEVLERDFGSRYEVALTSTVQEIFDLLNK